MVKKIIVLLFLVYIFLFKPAGSFAATKRVEVDLTHQRLYGFVDNTLVYNFLISSGKWNPTPTGTFYPYYKLRFDRMKGGNIALGTYYDLPNVPYVVYFYQGYSIHGTYWHNNFGHPMSHGCINMSIPEAAVIYNWIDFSTPIVIYGITPAI